MSSNPIRGRSEQEPRDEDINAVGAALEEGADAIMERWLERARHEPLPTELKNRE